MPDDATRKRLSLLRQIPAFAREDHRNLKDKDGKLPFFSGLTRKERRKLNRDSKKLAENYRKIMIEINNSGAGYEVDKLIRELCIEYTHRYASSGVYNQPLSFNYFEPFCKIEFVDKTIAPYAKPREEVVHLFNFLDFLEYATSEHSDNFSLDKLFSIPEGKIFHFNANGDISELCFLTPEGREFVVSGYSLVRHEAFVSWYIVGGELFQPGEWEALCSEALDIDAKSFHPTKQRFLEDAIKFKNDNSNPPTALRGMPTAQRWIVSGEIDLNTSKSLSKCYLIDHKNAFKVVCDDVSIFDDLSDNEVREDRIIYFQKKISEAAVLWSLGEALLKLPSYFEYSIKFDKKDIGVRKLKFLSNKKNTMGTNGQFVSIPSVGLDGEVSSQIRLYKLRHYDIDTSGHWRRINKYSIGKGPSGEKVIGRTWVKRESSLRTTERSENLIYVKSTLASGKKFIDQAIAQSEFGNDPPDCEETNVVYVLRCLLMNGEIFKIGWTSGSAEGRALELSRASGVPSSFIVVKYWHHKNAKRLEKNIHAILDPYRVNNRREFFDLPFEKIEQIIEAEIERDNSTISS